MMNYSHIPFKPRKFKLFYGWIIMVAGTIGIIFSIPGQTMGISVFTDHLIEALKLERQVLSMAYFLGTVTSSFLITYTGKLYDKLGARIMAIASAILLSGSLFLASFSPDISSWVSQVSNVKFPFVSFTIITGIFFLIRISGQGVLTMASRNMIMKWFDRLRGRANAISSVFVSFAFAISPLLFNALINNNSWPQAWRIIAFSLLGFTLFAFLFFRDNPEECKLKPDGNTIKSNTEKKIARKQFTLEEAKKTWPFWVFTAALAFYSFFGTGFTFNIVSIFETNGYTATEAVSVFLPISIVSIVISITGNYYSDFIRLQYLLFAMVIGELLASLGLIFLDTTLGYYVTIGGFGLMGGLFVVLVTVTWPRFYGRKYLGAISGLSGSVLVFSSAVGPYYFSLILDVTNNYHLAGLIGAGMVILIGIASFKAKNPQ